MYALFAGTTSMNQSAADFAYSEQLQPLVMLLTLSNCYDLQRTLSKQPATHHQQQHPPLLLLAQPHHQLMVSLLYKSRQLAASST